MLVVTGDSNPGPLASATSALTTELRQPSTSKTLTFFLYTVESYRLPQSHTQQTTNYVLSEHLFGVNRKHLPLQRGAIILWITKALTSQLSSSDPSKKLG